MLCYIMLCYIQIPIFLNILNDAEKEILAKGEVKIFSQENWASTFKVQKFP